MRGYLNEFGPGHAEPLVGVHISQEAVLQCTTCGACVSFSARWAFSIYPS
jgi:Fe-S oxidoreductase